MRGGPTSRWQPEPHPAPPRAGRAAQNCSRVGPQLGELQVSALGLDSLVDTAPRSPAVAGPRRGRRGRGPSCHLRWRRKQGPRSTLWHPTIHRPSWQRHGLVQRICQGCAWPFRACARPVWCRACVGGSPRQSTEETLRGKQSPDESWTQPLSRERPSIYIQVHFCSNELCQGPAWARQCADSECPV